MKYRKIDHIKRSGITAAAVLCAALLGGCGSSGIRYAQDSEIETVTESQRTGTVSIVESSSASEADAGSESAAESIPMVNAVEITPEPVTDPFDSATTDAELIDAAASYLDERASNVLDTGETTTHTLRDITLWGHPATVSVRYPDGAAGDSKPEYVRITFNDGVKNSDITPEITSLEGFSYTDASRSSVDGEGDYYKAYYENEDRNLRMIEAEDASGNGNPTVLILEKINADEDAATDTAGEGDETADAAADTGNADTGADQAADTAQTGTADTAGGADAGTTDDTDNTDIDIDALYADDDGGARAE